MQAKEGEAIKGKCRGERSPHGVPSESESRNDALRQSVLSYYLTHLEHCDILGKSMRKELDT